MSTRLQQVLRVGQERASAMGASAPERQPVSTAVNGEDSDEDSDEDSGEDSDEKWPPLPDWAWNLAPLDKELGKYYKERCEKEVKRLVQLLRETRETRDQAALMAEAAERSANTLEQKLKRQVESSKESDTELRKSTRMRVAEKERLIKEKETQQRQLQAALENAQKEAEEREKAWATKFAKLMKTVEDAQTAAAKGAEAASLARDKMEQEQKQVHAMVEALAVEAKKRLDSEEEVNEGILKLADCKEDLARFMQKTAILEGLVKNLKGMLADKDAQTEGTAILKQLVQKQKEVIAGMGTQVEILQKRAQMENTEADEEEHDQNPPDLEPVTPPGSPPGSPPADPNVETKPENPAQSDTYDAPFSEDSVRKIAIQEIETKLDAITKDWPRRGARTDKELQVQQNNYAEMYQFLMDDLKALNDTRNYALGVLTARVGYAYLKHLTPLAFRATKFLDEEMAKRVRIALFGMRYKSAWAECFSAFANVAKKNAHMFVTWYFDINTYVKNKRPGFKAFAKTGKLRQPLHELLDMTRKLSTEKKIQYFASKEYDNTNHQENVYKLCEALPLFVKMVEWVQDSFDVFKKVNDSAQRSNFDPAMLETCLKLDKSIHDLIDSVIDVQTIMADPTLQPGEQILEFFVYLDADDWVPFLKNAFLNDVSYNFDEEAYWSRKSGSL